MSISPHRLEPVLQARFISNSSTKIDCGFSGISATTIEEGREHPTESGMRFTNWRFLIRRFLNRRSLNWKFQAPVAIELFEWVICPALVKHDLATQICLGYVWDMSGRDPGDAG